MTPTDQLIRTEAAVLHEQPGAWMVQEAYLEPPREGELLVRMVSAGICRSDLHIAAGASSVRELPICGGHEGAGVVERVGPGVRGVAVGDHVVTSFIPACGTCRWCATGRQNLCRYGALILDGTQLDGSCRLFLPGADGDPAAVRTVAMLGTFSRHQVLDQSSCVVIDKDIPLDLACLLGCGVPTGWGSATRAAEVRPGQSVVVLGTGGVGLNAVQGAVACGAAHVVAVDPVELKRTTALQLGATQAFADAEEARSFLSSVTDGQGADAAIITIGDIDGSEVALALSLVAKDGVVVLTSQAPMGSLPVSLDLFQLSMFQKRIQGSLYGMGAPRDAIAELCDLLRAGRLSLAPLVTRTYPLREINQAFTDLEEGRNIRGVIRFDLDEE